ncbi:MULTISPECIES: PucR family transcriptional regulator [unclassified Pseudomonas]|uniref:PucR family transcriptional regulator n=1 Tax=unclassified Pseudomonas TaxID=196821 RepID=UPI000BD61FFF|nr:MULTISPECIES: PucR family transcriptional regulator [unclassified Pseudomonas]PVZ19735.1 PucR-like helix-turn-helix protein [Pseudomonas sp. URIL14HWK12:I12]PVZ22680.1 PucR-like helix-turn-helix protein [Pseudomonas sp. URIL14HWK12:I10]PVZ37690.1 PucR-like helix-turn-helix protein [Pseudomonas sp. URIL14HWK12:I11]SNZ15543.1 PucR C-terminal helix-turn-helix domain-containing protein [Pseudomonas sp. URIL14HWK12:I9]
MSLTLAQILKLPGLEEMAVRAGADKLYRRVRWPYVAENEGIAEWVVGGELVFITGINHARDEANLLSLVEDGVAVGIAGLVILTGGTFIHRIPPAVVNRAEALGLPLIEQPYLLKMVVVTHAIGTALVHMDHARHSQHDILGQLLSGDYPSLAIARQRAEHAQLPIERPRRLLVLRLSSVNALFEHCAPAVAEQRLQNIRQKVQHALEAWSQALPDPLPVVPLGDLFILLLPEHDTLGAELSALHQALRPLIEGLSLFMGLASRAEDCSRYRHALKEARQALNVAESLRPATGYCDFTELGVLRLLQAIDDRSVIDHFVQQTLGALIEPSRKHAFVLIRTLDALLRENGNALKASARLGVHRNTLNQRIQRIEQQTQQKLDDPVFRMNASVALLIWRMTEIPTKE